MNKVRINPVIAVIGLVSLILTVGYVFLLKPVFTQLGRHTAELNVRSEEQATQAKSTISSTSEMAALAEQVYALVPTQSNIYDVSVQIEALAQSEGVTFTGIDFANETGTATTSQQASQSQPLVPAGMSAATVSVGVSGDYAKLTSFAERLTTLERFIQIENLSVTSEGGEATIMQIVAKAYYKDEGGAQ